MSVQVLSYVLGIVAIIVGGIIVAFSTRSHTVAALEKRATAAWKDEAEAYAEKITRLEGQILHQKERIDKLEAENKTLREVVSGLPSIQQYTSLVTEQHRQLVDLIGVQHAELLKHLAPTGQ